MNPEIMSSLPIPPGIEKITDKTWACEKTNKTLLDFSFIQGIERFRRSVLIESNFELVSPKLSGSFYFVDVILTRES